MKHQNFYLKTVAALFAALASAITLTSNFGSKGVVAGVMAAASVILLNEAVKQGRRTGKTPRMKTALNVAIILSELLILIGAFSLPVVPKYLAVLVLAAIAFVELLRLESENDLNASFAHDIGRSGRIIVVSLALVAHSVNPYFLFYGLLFVGVLAVYDSLRLLHRLSRES